MAMTEKVKPPRIKGVVPAHYAGPLCYIVRTLRHSGARAAQEFISIVEDPKPKRLEDRAGQMLATADAQMAALHTAPQLYDEEGQLRPEWRRPLRANLLAKAPKTWADWPLGLIRYVSPHVHDVLEALEPKKHLFIPVDVSAQDREPFRLYVLFPGAAARRTALAMRANGIEYTLSERGTPIFRTLDWHIEDRFGYLNSDVIGSAHLFFDFRLGFIFSQEAVDRFGDILPSKTAFKPMGLKHESLESLR